MSNEKKQPIPSKRGPDRLKETIHKAMSALTEMEPGLRRAGVIRSQHGIGKPDPRDELQQSAVLEFESQGGEVFGRESDVLTETDVGDCPVELHSDTERARYASGEFVRYGDLVEHAESHTLMEILSADPSGALKVNIPKIGDMLIYADKLKECRLIGRRP